MGLIKEIDCKFAELSQGIYNNIVYALNTVCKVGDMGDLIHYRRILVHRYCNSGYAPGFSNEEIASKVKLMTIGCRAKECFEYPENPTTTTTSTIPVTTTTTTTPIPVTTTTTTTAFVAPFVTTEIITNISNSLTTFSFTLNGTFVSYGTPNNADKRGFEYSQDITFMSGVGATSSSNTPLGAYALGSSVGLFASGTWYARAYIQDLDTTKWYGNTETFELIAAPVFNGLVTVSDTTDTSYKLSWGAATAGARPLSEYKIIIDDVEFDSVSVGTLEFVVTGRSPSTPYSNVVRIVDNENYGDSSPAVIAVTLADPRWISLEYTSIPSRADAITACAELTIDTNYYIYMITPGVLANGDIVYQDLAGTIPRVGDGDYYLVEIFTNYTCTISPLGVVGDVAPCP